jgi:hypothetical protein
VGLPLGAVGVAACLPVAAPALAGAFATGSRRATASRAGVARGGLVAGLRGGFAGHRQAGGRVDRHRTGALLATPAAPAPARPIGTGFALAAARGASGRIGLAATAFVRRGRRQIGALVTDGRVAGAWVDRGSLCSGLHRGGIVRGGLVHGRGNDALAARIRQGHNGHFPSPPRPA